VSVPAQASDRVLFFLGSIKADIVFSMAQVFSPHDGVAKGRHHDRLVIREDSGSLLRQRFLSERFSIHPFILQ
jgi:hypothetical protein